ncbi:hypothetical protein M9Y10_005394 [Tritrichomonas musculus]|uniref:Uncharacterized protein n=1 Tax=Tritrichomonas musculus TaxID=1915356 RepID=A0ABR2JL10_9EUKA
MIIIFSFLVPFFLSVPKSSKYLAQHKNLNFQQTVIGKIEKIKDDTKKTELDISQSNLNQETSLDNDKSEFVIISSNFETPMVNRPTNTDIQTNSNIESDSISTPSTPEQSIEIQKDSELSNSISQDLPIETKTVHDSIEPDIFPSLSSLQPSHSSIEVDSDIHSDANPFESSQSMEIHSTISSFDTIQTETTIFSNIQSFTEIETSSIEQHSQQSTEEDVISLSDSQPSSESYQSLTEIETNFILPSQSYIPTEIGIISQSQSSMPTETDIPSPSQSSIPTETDIPSPSQSPLPTETDIPSPSQSPLPTETDIPSPSQSSIPTETDIPSPSQSPLPIETDIPSPSQSPLPIETDIPSPSQSPLPIETDIPSPSQSPLPIETATVTFHPSTSNNDDVHLPSNKHTSSETDNDYSSSPGFVSHYGEIVLVICGLIIIILVAFMILLIIKRRQSRVLIDDQYHADEPLLMPGEFV